VSPGAQPAGARRALAAAALIGVLGGIATGVVWVLPVASGWSGGAALAQGMAVLLVAWSVYRALRAVRQIAPALTFGAAVACGVACALTASAAFGTLLYVLYRWLSPDALNERYAGYVASVMRSGRPATAVAAELARLALHRAQYLDPAIAAATAAVTMACVGLVAAAYLAWAQRSAKLRASSSAGTRA